MVGTMVGMMVGMMVGTMVGMMVGRMVGRMVGMMCFRRENRRRQVDHDKVSAELRVWHMANSTLDVVDGRVMRTHNACPRLSTCAATCGSCS